MTKRSASTSSLEFLPFFGLTGSRVTALVALTVLAAAFEGFGMAMFLPVLEFIEKGRDVAVLAAGSPMWGKLIQAFDFLGLSVTLVTLLTAALGAMMLRVVFIYARQIYSAWLSQEVLHVTRSNLFDAYDGHGLRGLHRGSPAAASSTC